MAETVEMAAVRGGKVESLHMSSSMFHNFSYKLRR